jgi:GMP synthase (glutamine-hydrolysing)
MARILVVLHAADEHLGALERPLLEAAHELDIRAMPGTLPESLRGYDGIIVMGGTMGAYEGERYPFLRDEIGLLGQALASERPALGVCLGSQLLAAAAGARVYTGPSIEVGWLPVRRLADDHWLSGWPDEFEPLHWHGDTFDLPVGATLVASSTAYPHQAFRIGSGLGLQFHVEATAEMARSWWTALELGERWRPPADAIEHSEQAAARMRPLVRSLAAGFGDAVSRAASARR